MIRLSNPFKKASKYNVFTMAVSCFLLSMNSANGQNELFLNTNQYNALQIDGANTFNQTLVISDPDHGQGGVVTLEGHSYIKVWINHNEPPHNLWYRYDIEFSVAPLLQNGQPTTPHTRKLTVEYNPYSSGGLFKDLSLYEITNHRGAHIQIISVTYKDMDTQQTYTTTPQNVMLETGIRVNRFYNLDTSPISVTSTQNNGEVKLIWNSSFVGSNSGALSYDVEW